MDKSNGSYRATGVGGLILRPFDLIRKIGSGRLAHLPSRNHPSRSILSGDLPADDQALNIAGALVDLANPDIAVDPLDRKILQIAVAAMDLDRVGAYPLGHFR